MPSAIVLERYEAASPAGDPDAGFRQMVTEYSRLDPLPTLENLSRSTGIPVGALARFVLVRYCTSGSDALLEIGPRVVRQTDEIVQHAEAAASDAARPDAYRSLKAILSWLIVPLSDPNPRTGGRVNRGDDFSRKDRGITSVTSSQHRSGGDDPLDSVHGTQERCAPSRGGRDARHVRAAARLQARRMRKLDGRRSNC